MRGIAVENLPRIGSCWSCLGSMKVGTEPCPHCGAYQQTVLREAVPGLTERYPPQKLSFEDIWYRAGLGDLLQGFAESGPQTPEQETLYEACRKSDDLAVEIHHAYYHRKSDPRGMQTVIEKCHEMISLSTEAARYYRQKGWKPLPTHKGYTRLAITLEQQSRYDEAIRVSKQARFQGWYGKWDERIARLERLRDGEAPATELRR